MPQINGQQLPYPPQGGGQGFNPNQNPFAQLLQQGMGGSGPTMGGGAGRGILPQGGPAPQRPAPQGGTPAAQGEEMPEEELPGGLQSGDTGDNAKPLLSAIQNLQNYIGASTEPQEIKMVRNLVTVLTKLLAKDQERATKVLDDHLGTQTMGQGQIQVPLPPQI